MSGRYERKIKTCKELQKKVVPNYSFFFWVVVVICLGILGIGLFYTWRAAWVRCSFSVDIGEGLYDYIFTLGTVIVAVVVLYYTMQDSHREGIPRRKVVAYFVGSRTIVTLFGLENIALIVLAIIKDMKRCALLYSIMISTLIIQLYIMIIIILASSSEFSRCCVKKAEDEQFRCLMEYSITNRQYVWNYFIHHMPWVIAGEDMIYDKIILMRRLLTVPIDYKWEKTRDIVCSIQTSEEWKPLAYEFYFHNLTMTFEQLTGAEECNQIFQLLYEFVSELPETGKCSKGKDKTLIVSAILNAALVSNLVKAEAFCCHILNNCVFNEELRRNQVWLYILFLDHLFRTEKEKVQMEQLAAIRGFSELKYDGKNESEYKEFWYIWSVQSDIPRLESDKYLYEALQGLAGKKGISAVIDYCWYTMRQ